LVRRHGPRLPHRPSASACLPTRTARSPRRSARAGARREAAPAPAGGCVEELRAPAEGSVLREARDLFLDDGFGELGDDLPYDALHDLAREREDRVGLLGGETELAELAREVAVHRRLDTRRRWCSRGRRRR